MILAVIGVDFSPACAVNYLNRGPVIYSSQGIYVEELRRCLKDRNMNLHFVGVNQRWRKKLQADLDNLISSDRGIREKSGDRVP